MTIERIKLLSVETDCMLSASEILHDVGKNIFLLIVLIFTNAKVGKGIRT